MMNEIHPLQKKKDDDEWFFSNGWSKETMLMKIFNSNVSLKFSMPKSFEYLMKHDPKLTLIKTLLTL
jgi:hypothetical protein